MIPRGSDSLGHLAMRIAVDLIPKASDAYAATDMGYFTVLLSLVGQDFDRVADIAVVEHEETLSIFDAAAPHLVDADLKRRIAEAKAKRLPSFKTADLNTRGDIETRLLIEVHEAVEAAVDRGEAWAGALDAQIWRFLDGYASRRAYDAPF